MLAVADPAVASLADHFDALIRDRDVGEITQGLRKTLCRMMREGTLKLPAICYQPCADHYARRELHRSESLGYSVIAMTWGPGQGTPIHDHSGMWCVEGVVHGAIEIEQFELREQDGERFRFESVGSLQAGAGSAGSLIPPHEYHTICNPSPDSPAVSLHIYGGCMTCCSVFRPGQDGWYRRELKQLGLD